MGLFEFGRQLQMEEDHAKFICNLWETYDKWKRTGEMIIYKYEW